MRRCCCTLLQESTEQTTILLFLFFSKKNAAMLSKFMCFHIYVYQKVTLNSFLQFCFIYKCYKVMYFQNTHYCWGKVFHSTNYQNIS